MGKARLRRCPCCGKMKVLSNVEVEDYLSFEKALLKKKKVVDLPPPSGFETRRAFKRKRLADKKALMKKRRLNKKGLS